MGAGGDFFAGIADHLGVFAHRLAGGDVTRRQFVVAGNDAASRDRLDGGSRFQRAGCGYDIVFRIEADGQGHGNGTFTDWIGRG